MMIDDWNLVQMTGGILVYRWTRSLPPTRAMWKTYLRPDGAEVVNPEPKTLSGFLFSSVEQVERVVAKRNLLEAALA